MTFMQLIFAALRALLISVMLRLPWPSFQLQGQCWALVLLLQALAIHIVFSGSYSS